MSAPDVIRVPEPEILAISAEGSLIAAAAPAFGNKSVYLIGTAERAVLSTLETRSDLGSIALSANAAVLFVGAKVISTFSTANGKKLSVTFKGHKSPPRALLVDGGWLFSAGGSRTYADDCAVRAYDVATGDLTWTAKRTKGQGFGSLARVGDVLFAACDDGHLWAIHATTGAVLGMAWVGEGATMGGVASNGDVAVVNWVRKNHLHVCFVELRGKAIAIEGVSHVPTPSADVDEGLLPCAPVSSRGASIALVAAKCWTTEAVHIGCVIDLTRRAIGAPFTLAGAGDVQGLRAIVAHDNRIAWPTAEGVAVLAKPPR